MGLVYLTGMSGSGKSTVGPELARLLRVEFIELDQLISDDCRLTIPELFAQSGESRFRDIESKKLREISSRQSAVISLGGGAIERKENYETVRASGTLVYLDASIEVIIDRASLMTDRPLLSDAHDPRQLRERLTSMFERRRARYESAHLRVSVAGKSALEIAIEIAGLLAA